ncbi:hypothetical protein [Listeria sp. PSOL-1]|uniref:hypothetical protein n=1 Tax=Listeria sp. PSOL-1 TaxID=1844999 RepID=UPI0013CFFFEF|nr:hypothetical protein [Listeria sp. PSOL-1]
MTNKFAKQQKKLLEQEHRLPYTLSDENQRYSITIYRMLGKISGIVIFNQEGNVATSDEAKRIAHQLQKYTFYFDYLSKRAHSVKERDSVVAKKIEQSQFILNEQHLFGQKMQVVVNELALGLEVYKQEQHKLDIYQDDISLLNEKIKEQKEILSEDWKTAENLSIEYKTTAYAQSIALEQTRKNRHQLIKWYHENQKQLPNRERKDLGKLVSLLSDMSAGLVFDQIISLIPLLEKGLMLDKEQILTKRIFEFNKEYAARCHFFKPNTNKISHLIRN